MLERYAGGGLANFELLHWYRSRLAANAAVRLTQNGWAYGYYAQGALIACTHRLAYHTNPNLREFIPGPFAAEPGCIDEILAQQAP